MGFEVERPLSIFTQLTGFVKFFSSHPLLAYFKKPFDKEIEISSDYTQIKFAVKSFATQPKNIYLSCVNLRTKELISHWLVRVRTSQPNITQVKKINCKV